MSISHVLLQFGADPFLAKFEDLDGRTAFTVAVMDESPNLLAKVSREADWSQQQIGIMGPSSSFLYFGPSRTAGYLVYGNGPTQPMALSRRQKREGSPSRYFTAQNGKDYKWKIFPQRMECIDGRSVIAVWEMSEQGDAFSARLTIKHAALPIVTELLTTLTLNRMAQALEW